MLESVIKQKYHVILVVLGFILVMASFFKVEDISKFQVSPNPNPLYIPLTIGVLFVFASILSFLLTEDSIGWGWLSPATIKKTEEGYSVALGQATLNVLYGRLENYSSDKDTSVIVLPANEYFDDECINDKDSSLGAYMHAKFSTQIEAVKNLVSTKVQSMPSKSVEKESGCFQQSYGVGKCIYLDRPLSSEHKIILTAVTSQRAGQGLKSEISYIFQAVNEIYKLMVDKRLRRVYSPLMGAGHGCLRTEVALFTLVLAWSEILCKPLGPHIEVNIIIFRNDKSDKQRPSRRVVKRILKIATGMFKN
jgi:O-acetyl-ADP-ribose deacetylase (regulator of RNase III)